MWCSSCATNIERPAHMGGLICCSFCGRVLDEDNFATELTFVKNAAGQAQLGGCFVKTIQGEYSVSRQRILDLAREDMDTMLNSFNEENRDSIVSTALNFYTIGIERNFTRGRRRELVEAACIYLACRENKKPYLLIDFAEFLRINVYVLGAVFLQLCKLLSLQEHPIVQKPVDPSLFIHRFANCLVGEHDYKEVARNALKIIAGMKRDWMQTGRKPSGICGAALYISAISHCGHKYTKSDITKIVHICDATLTKRLIEFEETESGSLTIEEFIKKADEHEKESRSRKQPDTELKDLLCEHKGSGIPAHAHGLCRSCYDEFIQLSGGLDGGSEPPAFQRAERERKAKECAEENANDSSVDEMACNTQNSSNNLNIEKEPDTLEASVNEKSLPTDADTIGDATKHVETDGTYDKLHEEDVSNTKEGDDESDNFSDIDDSEVDGYIHNEQEQQFKKIIWEQMNREYIEEQAAKEAAAAAAKAAYEANLSNHPDDVKARELAAAAAARVAKSRKEKQQKRAAEAKNAPPAQSAAEATKQMLTRKRLSSKINYDVLDKLFEETAPLEKDPKKSRVDKEEEDAVHNSENEIEPEEAKHEEEDDEYGDGGADIAPDFYYDHENVETYDYEDDYGYDGY
ncbi:hypothetical protein LguiA_024456 [Lonicera macranthoides]